MRIYFSQEISTVKARSLDAGPFSLKKKEEKAMKIYESYEDLPKLKLPYGNEVFISDSTIRDGSQMPGIVLSREHKLQIYEYLHEIGI